MTKHLEDFDIADQVGLAGLDLTWAIPKGNWKIITNQAENNATSADAVARAQHDTGSADMYALLAVTHGLQSTTYAGVAVRMNASDGAFYSFEVNGTDTLGIYRYGASGFYEETVASGTFTFPSAFVLELHVNGSLLTGYIDGLQVISGTNGTITTGQRGGFTSYVETSTTRVRFNNFEMGALSDLGTLIVPSQASGSGSAQSTSLTATATIAATVATGTGTAGASSVASNALTTIAPTTKIGVGTAGVPALVGIDAPGILRRIGGYPSPSYIAPASPQRTLVVNR